MMALQRFWIDNMKAVELKIFVAAIEVTVKANGCQRRPTGSGIVRVTTMFIGSS